MIIGSETKEFPKPTIMADAQPSSPSGTLRAWLGRRRLPSFSGSQFRQIAFSVMDQGFAVGGMFVANIALARTQSKEEYGIFALSYSVFTFLAGLHNACILEAYTIYGSGRYSKHFSSYAKLLWRSNAVLCFSLTIILLGIWGVLALLYPALGSRSVLGMALTSGVLLTASFIRRTFYMRRRPNLAARFSVIFFSVFCGLLWLAIQSKTLSGFWAFVISATAWSVAALVLRRELPRGTDLQEEFMQVEPGYWAEHWKYSRWVFVTALVFQFMTQGYFWLSASLLSVRDVGNLRAMYNLVIPLDQLFSAVTLLILPLLSFRFASRRLAGLIPLWKKYCIGWLGLTGSFAAFVMLFGRRLMHVVYAGRFDDISVILPVLAVLPVIMGVGNTINAALKSMERPQSVFYAYVASGSTTFLVGIPMILRFGLRGAVYGMLASAAMYTSALAIAFLSSTQRENRALAVATQPE